MPIGRLHCSAAVFSFAVRSGRLVIVPFSNSGCKREKFFIFQASNKAMKKSLLPLFLFCITVGAAAQKAVTDKAVTAASPVLKTYVPPDVVAKAVKKYGRELYCITQVKNSYGELSYIVGLIRNGRLTNEWMDEIKIAFTNKDSGVFAKHR